MQFTSIFHRMMNHIWYGESHLRFLLIPFACVYSFILRIRALIVKRYPRWQAPVPIIVVGNLTVGGVGKTPLVVAIANYYTKRGFKVGIVSRGYGAQGCRFPYQVTSEDLAIKVGDEPLLLSTLTNCPVMIAPKRVLAVKELLKNHHLDLIISDDGLQHQALTRQVEIVVIDAVRAFGNGLLLPAGPLREPVTRLKSVDFIVLNCRFGLGATNTIESKQVCNKIENHAICEVMGSNAKSILYKMQFQMRSLKNIKSGKEVKIDVLKNGIFNAVAGIGNPELFFMNLKQLGLYNFNPLVFPDHYVYKKSDFNNIHGPLVMTEKDAVKCMSFAMSDWYSLGIDAYLDKEFWNQLTDMTLVQVDKQ